MLPVQFKYKKWNVKLIYTDKMAIYIVHVVGVFIHVVGVFVLYMIISCLSIDAFWWTKWPEYGRQNLGDIWLVYKQTIVWNWHGVSITAVGCLWIIKGVSVLRCLLNIDRWEILFTKIMHHDQFTWKMFWNGLITCFLNTTIGCLVWHDDIKDKTSSHSAFGSLNNGYRYRSGEIMPCWNISHLVFKIHWKTENIYWNKDAWNMST